MQISAQVTGLSAALKIAEIKATMAALKGITKAGDQLKNILRDQVMAAGFSSRLATTWQGKVYPNRGMNPAAYVYSKAPRIIDGYARGATIVATGGRRFLALPTHETPLKRSGGRAQQQRAMSPLEVEQKFGRKLRFIPARSAQGSVVGAKAVGFLIMDNLATRKSSGNLRNASARELRLAGTGKARPVESIVMFVLVRGVKLPKLFDLEATARAAASTVPDLIAESWSDA